MLTVKKLIAALQEMDGALPICVARKTARKTIFLATEVRVRYFQEVPTDEGYYMVECDDEEDSSIRSIVTLFVEEEGLRCG